MEIELIREFYKDSNISGSTEKLFQVHYSLFHLLYKLKQRAGKDNYYLHIDPMRIRLIPVPSEQFCSYYNAEKGRFCNKKIEKIKSNFCGYHIQHYGDTLNKLVFDPLYEFYNNSENINFGKSEILKKLMRGAVVYALRKGELDRALKFFGIVKPDGKIIKKKYHELARKYHPDKSGGDDRMMKALNISYQILREVYVL